jgi:hypothetical protein
MRVLRLQAENFKRLVAVDITPAGDVVTITGRNAQGKSSVLDAIFAALAGADAAPDAPIRKGAREGKVTVDLGEYVVTRTYRLTDAGKVTTSLAVENGKGARFPSPQSLIDKLIGKLSFDPLFLVRLSETPAGRRQQFDMLAKLVPGVDFDAIANENRGDYEKRTDVNRRAKRRARPPALSRFPKRCRSASTRRRSSPRCRAPRSAKARSPRTGAGSSRCRTASMTCASAPPLLIPSDNASWRDSRNSIPSANGSMRTSTPSQLMSRRYPSRRPCRCLCGCRPTQRSARDEPPGRRGRAQARAEGALTQTGRFARKPRATNLTARMDARDKAKNEAIAAAKMPVTGLTFGDGEILLNGVPFSQGSSAEQLKTSVAIAAALNPTLRVIHVRDGSLLDDESMTWLAEYARANDLQVWCEVVGTDDKVGVLIEDGHVRDAAKADAA